MKFLRSIGHIARVAWRYSLVLTLPISFVFLIWALAVGTRYYEFGLRYGDAMGNPDLYYGGVYQFERMKSEIRIALVEDGPETEENLSQVHLMLNDESEAQLNSYLPSSGRKYKKGFLQYPDGSLGEVDLRYRGDFAWHWATHKKSWRVKTDKKAMWNGMRKFNLIVPKGMGMVEDHLGYWLGTEMGLLSPRSERVEVIINGEGRGLHTMVEQIEELLLRRNGRMPGDIFVGELIGRDAHEGLINWVFDHPGLWAKSSINNHFLEEVEENKSLVRLTELLRMPASDEMYSELRSLLDVEAFGRFAAFRTLTQCKHYDRAHNWRLYYDPWKNRFEPVIWDTVPWTRDWMPRPGEQPFLEPLFCRLDDILAQDHQYRNAMGRAIQHFFESGLREDLMQEFNRLANSMGPALRRDPVLTDKLNYVTAEEVESYQQTLRASMNKLFDTLEQEYVAQPPIMSATELTSSTDAKRVWRLALYGRRGITGVRVELEKPMQAPPQVNLEYMVDGKEYSLDVSSLCKSGGRTIDIEAPMSGSLFYKANPESKTFGDRGRMELAAGSFDLTLASPDGSVIEPVRIAALLGGGRLCDIRMINEMPRFTFRREFGIVEAPMATEPLIWEGTMVMKGQQTINAPVIIRPGTKILMAPEASVILEGGLIAGGTEDQPIRVQSQDPSGPAWGTFALRGPGSDHSTLRHVKFQGGSGWKQSLAEYSSMFSIHWCQDVLVEDCVFRGSGDVENVDDTVHGVYSSVDFIRCWFVESHSDALDMDISETFLDRCVFEDSGNDAVDLMTTRAVVINTKFFLKALKGRSPEDERIGNGEVWQQGDREEWRTGDKGISIGEGSKLVSINNLFDSCKIALQAKDQSVAAVVNSDILNCGIGIDAYKKNWRYNGGGEIYLYKCRVLKNDLALRRDKHSILGLSDTYSDGLEKGWQERYLRGVGMIHSTKSKAAAKPGRPYRFEAERAQMGSLGLQQWSSVREEERGSTLLKLP